MKALYAFFGLLLLISCSASDESDPQPAVDPTKLLKIVFHPGSVQERHWNFNQDGLLKEITKPDGTVLQNFIYDARNNMVSTTSFSAAGNSTTAFTYDADDWITSVNGYPVAYNYYAGSRYIFTYEVPECEECAYDYPHKSEIELNSDRLIVSQKDFFNWPTTNAEFSYPSVMVDYSGENLSSVTFFQGTEKHFAYDNKTNPLKLALLPVCRAYALVFAGSYDTVNDWIDGEYMSAKNVVLQQYAADDPESNLSTYQYNALDLPVTRTVQPLFSGAPDGSPFLYAHYYYQGDTLP